MIDLSNSEAALLGLLSEGPMHPYQVEQEVKYRDMRYWTELSMSSIYKLLRKLEKDGLVQRSNEISSENRLRKLYTISDSGLAALKAKITQILSTTEHTKWQIDIGTYNLNLLTAKEALEALEHYRRSLLEKVQGYRELNSFLQEIKCPPHRLAVATRPVCLLEAEVKWVDSYMEEIAKEGTGQGRASCTTKEGN